MAHDVISTCPICSSELAVTRLHCASCGTTLEGDFSVGRFGRLNRDQLTLLESFLRSRGNLREMERELGISYPTVRSRVEALVRALGFGPRPDDDADDRVTSPAAAPATREEILQALARHEMSAEDAAAAIRALGRTDIVTTDDRIPPRTPDRRRRPAGDQPRSGTIRLRAIDGDAVRVRDAAATTSPRRFAIELGPGTAALRRSGAAAASPACDRAGGSAELDIDVPRRATVVIDGTSAEIEADRPRRRPALPDRSRATSRCAASAARSAVDAVSGDVDVTATDRTALTARTVSGDLDLRAATLTGSTSRRRAATSRSPAGWPATGHSLSRPSAATPCWRLPATSGSR